MRKQVALPMVVAWLALTGCASAPDTDSVNTADADVVAPMPAYNVREGRSVFLHYCAPCHGEDGRGDGFNSYSLDPRPADLAEPSFHRTRTDEDLSAVVRAGGGATGLSPLMPPWGRTLDERQIHNLVRFVRQLPKQVDQASEE